MFKKVILFAAFSAVVISSIAITQAASELISITATPAQATVGQTIAVSVTVQLDPDTPSSDNEYNEITLTLPDGFDINSDTINVSGDDFDLVGDVSIDGNVITFPLNDISSGETIEINFSGQFNNTVIDGQAYTFIAELTNGTDTEESDTSVIASNPTTYSLDKTVVSPTGNVYPGDQVTYQITASFGGTAELSSPIEITDVMDSNATFISASDDGVNSGELTTWELSEDEIEARTATRTITYQLDSDSYQEGDVVTNNANLIVNDTEVATDSAQVTISDSETIIIPEPIEKNSSTSTDADGNATTTDGLITYTFEPIDIQGSATLDDVQIVDEVGENLIVDTIYPGTYEGGGELQSITITYDDGTPDTVITDLSQPYTVDPDEQAHVATITYNFGTVQLPFKATVSPKIDMTVNPEFEQGQITNNFHVDFKIHSDDGSIGEGTFTCPPGYEQATNSDDDADCVMSSSDNVIVINKLPFASLQEQVVDPKTYYNGEQVQIKYTLTNESDSQIAYDITNIANDYPEELEYISTDSEYNVTQYDGYVVLDTPLTLNPGDTYTYTNTYNVVGSEVATITDNSYVYFVKQFQVAAGKQGVFKQEPNDYLVSGETNPKRVLNNNTTLDINPPQVLIEKTDTDDDKIYLPDSIEGANHQINYNIKLSNVDFGKSSASLVNPQIVDDIPDNTSLIESSVVVSGYFNNSDIADLTVNSGDFSITFNGELPVGESVSIDYQLQVDEGISAGFKTNTATYTKNLDAYAEGSIFTDSDATALIKPVATQFVEKEVDKAQIAPGEQVTYTIVYKNTGTVDISDVNFTDMIPASDDGRGTTIDSVVVDSPTFTAGDTSTFKFVYELDDGTSTETIPTDHSTIKAVKINFDDYVINPSESFTFTYKLTSPNDAIGGDLIYNNATYDSVAYFNDAPFGANDGKLSNTTNTVETVIEARDETLAEIGDFVYLDVDRDGSYDESIDEPLDNYNVELKDGSGNLIEQTVTNNGGYYKFSNLTPQDYIVSIYNDNGDYLLTNQDIAVDSVAEPEYNDADFRYEPASISGELFIDDNANGIFDTDETLYPNTVKIGLYDQNNELISEIDSQNSSYLFDTLKAGTYIVKASDQYSGNNYYYTVQSSYTINSDYSQQVSVNLAPGAQETRDFGLVIPAKITGYVFEDLEQDGVYHEDQYINDVNIKLLGDDEQNKDTADDGYFEFLVYPGTYQLSSELVSSHMFSPKQNDSTVDEQGLTDNINVTQGQVLRYDIGQVPLVDIGGNYYYDKDADESFDNDDEYLANRNVELYQDTTLISITTTDSDGDYQFNDLQPNVAYKVIFEKGDSEIFILPTSTGEVDLNPYPPASEDYTIDASVYVPVSISGSVYIDEDYSQNINSLDTVLANYDVELYSEDEELISTTTTDTNGLYQFNNLIPDTYYVKITNTTYEEVPQGDLSAVDSFKFKDEISPDYTLSSGEVQENVNKGLFNYISLSGNVFEDMQANGELDSEDKSLEIPINLYYNGELFDTFTSADGFYEFDNLYPGNYYIIADSDYVVTTQDKTGVTIDSDINQDKTSTEVLITSGTRNDVDFDAGFYQYATIGDLIYIDGDNDGFYDISSERVAPFIKVELIDSDGNVVATTRTKPSSTTANYLFTDVIPGTYSVRAADVTGFSYANIDGGIQTDGTTEQFAITSNQTIDTKDGRLILDRDNPSILKTSVGDYVWEDVNYNGLQDEGEPAISDVGIDLYNTDGLLIYQTTTDENGYYNFDVAPGEYQIHVDISDDYSLTTTNESDDVTIDSNNLDENSFSDVITVDILQADESIDFGFYQDATISGTYFYDYNRDSVLNDSDYKLANETINLVDSNGEIIDTTTSDEDGYYEFTNLIPAKYSVNFVVPDTEYLHISKLSNDVEVTLLSNQHVENIDYAYHINSVVSGYYYEDVDNNKDLDSEDKVISDVGVNLLSDGEIVSSTTTNRDGYYEFSDLEPGDYVIEFTYQLQDNENYQDLANFNNNQIKISVADNSVYEDNNGAIITDEVVIASIVDTGITSLYLILPVILLVLSLGLYRKYKY